jgi:hypothetical protein
VAKPNLVSDFSARKKAESAVQKGRKERVKVKSAPTFVKSSTAIIKSTSVINKSTSVINKSATVFYLFPTRITISWNKSATGDSGQ